MTTHGFNLHSIGVILIVVGIVGLLISLFWMTVWAGRRERSALVRRRDGTVYRERDELL